MGVVDSPRDWASSRMMMGLPGEKAPAIARSLSVRKALAKGSRLRAIRRLRYSESSDSRLLASVESDGVLNATNLRARMKSPRGRAVFPREAAFAGPETLTSVD